MPRFISTIELALVLEAVRRIERKVNLIMTLVSIDDSVLANIATSLQTIDEEVTKLVQNPNINIQPADVTAITDTLSDITSKLAQPTTPVDTGTPADGGDASAPADGGDTSAPADGGDTSAPADSGTPDDGSAAGPADAGTPVEETPAEGGTVADFGGDSSPSV